MKKVKTCDEAWDVQETFEGEPHGWIQWKGTDVCMDVHCKCGVSSHIDSDFVYVAECPACHAKYMCNGHIQLIEIEEHDMPCQVGSI